MLLGTISLTAKYSRFNKVLLVQDCLADAEAELVWCCAEFACCMVLWTVTDVWLEFLCHSYVCLHLLSIKVAKMLSGSDYPTLTLSLSWDSQVVCPNCENAICIKTHHRHSYHVIETKILFEIWNWALRPHVSLPADYWHKGILE